MDLATMNHNFDVTAASENASASNSAPATAASSLASTSPRESVSVTSPMSIDAACNASRAPHAPAIKRRSPIACRRCRRMRSKCIHEKGKSPCKSCFEAGIPTEECVFPTRGQPDLDREYRHPRTRSDKSNKGVTGAAAKSRRSITGSLSTSPRRSTDDWDSLPPTADLIDGVRLLTQQYFQLGFIPKEQYTERLRKDMRSTSLFLLMSILSVSARLSPALKLRYGSGVQAAEFFIERASYIANEEVYQEPTLERCQAFFLLSIAQQNSGERHKSYINMGIAMRMAILMQLHCEETYHISNPTPELIMRAESARRTMWMLHSQDNLHSGPLSPVSLAASDITTLLPSDEEDFINGREPRSRAAMDGTPPAIEHPKLIRDPGRSLFATLMQVHGWWGLVGRRAVRYGKSLHPWDPASEFAQTARKLREWEQDLPHEHVWSTFLLKGYKAERQELAYLCVTMMTRLSNIVLRRPYLIDIIKSDKADATKQAFFQSMSDEIFANVRYLYEQIDAQFTNRSPDEVAGAQISAFCVYSCGLFSTYLCKYPHICHDKALVRDGPKMLQRTIGILKECRQVWSFAGRWVDALEKFSLDTQCTIFSSHEGSMNDGKNSISLTARQLPPLFPNKLSCRQPGPHHPPLSFPEPNILPRPLGTQPELPPASSIESPPHQSANSISGAAMKQMQYLPSPPPQHPHSQSFSQYSKHHASLPPAISASSAPFSVSFAQSQSHMMQPTRIEYAPSQQTPPPPQTGRRSADGLGMLIDAFDSSQPPSPRHAARPFHLPLGPGTDGFEGELQYYIDGPPATWLKSTPCRGETS
ncbi:hypothetical protein E4U17_002502 [Claviceps sp. LM77 group G4]|nr:hypothetical protein E4U17_002502 [Claviceps sp. LM77 group G4]KAG6071315.1 hypothetical protein E4U33_003761 [Claviceps sp. LM78 group G4]KAG6076382.1 hypothetical protein E4U16_002804 [Claviceps sp. LM84 group G4]